MILDSLFVKLGFQLDTDQLEQFKGQVAEARDTVFTLTAALAASAGAFALFVTSQAEAIDELGDFAEQEGVAIEALQELGHAAQLSGSSLDAVKASVQGVNRVVGEAALGIGRGAMTFQKLHLQAKNADGTVKSFDQVLTEVADKMQGLSRQESIALAEKLGIDRSLIPLLMKGSEEIQKLREEAQAFGVTTEESAAAAGDLVDELDRSKFLIGALAKSIAVGFMPQIRNVIQGFRDWVMENRKVIKSGIERVIDVLTAIIGRLWSVLRAVGGAVADAVSWLLKFKVVILALGAAFGLLIGYQVVKTIQAIVTAVRVATAAMMAFNGSVLLIPAAIGAIIVALGLLIDDWMTWRAGGDSVIGSLIEQFPELEAVIKQVDAAITAVGEYFVALWDQLEGPLGELLAAFGELATVLGSTLWPIIKMVFTGWGLILLEIIPIVAQVLTFVVSSITTVIRWITTAIDAVVGGFNKVKSLVGWIGDKLGLGSNINVSGAISSAPAARTGEMAVPGTAKGGVLGRAETPSNNSSSQVVNNNSNTKIEIKSTDPVEAGREVGRVLDQRDKQTTRNGQTAVAL